MREEYTVKLRRPEGVSIARMQEYIRDAVLNWGGQFEPGVDPLFYPWKRKGRNSVHVKKK
jgi:hypothetical protein